MAPSTEGSPTRRRKKPGLKVQAFDSVRSANREIAGSTTRTRRDRLQREICSIRRTKLPMAINFITVARFEKEFGPRGERWMVRRAWNCHGILKKEKKREGGGQEERAIIPDSIIRGRGPRRTLCRIVKRLCPDDLHPVLARLARLSSPRLRPIDYHSVPLLSSAQKSFLRGLSLRILWSFVHYDDVGWGPVPLTQKSDPFALRICTCVHMVHVKCVLGNWMFFLVKYMFTCF